MKSFSIKDIPEFSVKDRIVVVGVIGKSPYRYPNKTTPLLTSVQCDENGVQCYWDERNSILYLHAITYMDTKQLTTLVSSLDENSKATDKDADACHWLVASGELAVESCRSIALIFNLCHIVVLSSPTPVFDLGYLQLFKAIDAFRTELSADITEALTSSGAGGNWVTHGRTCCPRLLFHFHRAPRPLKRNPAALKRLEHSVEDQLYFILRKARIITNVCAKSLFAIPKNEEFVYINAEDEGGTARDVTSLIRGLVGLCSGAGDTQSSTGNGERASFRQFLNGHVELAFTDGFDDNVGKYAMSTSFFELPSAQSWRLAAQALAPLCLDPAARSTHDAETAGALYDALATDVRFSQARCAKVLPIAQASYAEGLPPHYSSQHHAHKMSVASSLLETMARGPAAAAARRRLRGACEVAWRARRLCELPSLTDHPCVNPHHDSSIEHSSGVRYVLACNCGRCKTSREDPYSVRAANLLFYQTAAQECGVCVDLPAVVFPTFEPTTATYRAASVKGGAGRGSQEEGGAGAAGAAGGSQGDPPEGAWSPSSDPLSPGSQDDEDEDTSPKVSSSPTRYHVVSLDDDSHTERRVSWSTTEYLPGLLHTRSPAGLLPRYSSWSLLQLGVCSLYSHTLGLPEHLQPGFLTHTNYLTVWDCAVSRAGAAQVAAWRAAQGPVRGRSGKAAAAPLHHLTVKIFIGFEYECPRGHRFMMSSPDTVTSSGRGGAGSVLASSDMPLYTTCPCRGNKPMLAQCARIHVVTPKAPLHVTLDPKVQPIENGPVFVPQPASDGPIKLSPSAYWILRLPYIYADERGPLRRPKSPETSGRILAPMFGLAD